jgi:hypothetical protein
MQEIVLVSETLCVAYVRSSSSSSSFSPPSSSSSSSRALSFIHMFMFFYQGSWILPEFSFE